MKRVTINYKGDDAIQDNFTGMRWSPGENVITDVELGICLRKLGGCENGLGGVPATLGQLLVHLNKGGWERDELELLSFYELRKIARDKGIQGRSKVDLINSLEGKVK